MWDSRVRTTQLDSGRALSLRLRIAAADCFCRIGTVHVRQRPLVQYRLMARAAAVGRQCQLARGERTAPARTKSPRRSSKGPRSTSVVASTKYILSRATSYRVLAGCAAMTGHSVLNSLDPIRENGRSPNRRNRPRCVGIQVNPYCHVGERTGPHPKQPGSRVRTTQLDSGRALSLRLRIAAADCSCRIGTVHVRQRPLVQYRLRQSAPGANRQPGRSRHLRRGLAHFRRLPRNISSHGPRHTEYGCAAMTGHSVLNSLDPIRENGRSPNRRIRPRCVGIHVNPYCHNPPTGYALCETQPRRTRLAQSRFRLSLPCLDLLEDVGKAA